MNAFLKEIERRLRGKKAVNEMASMSRQHFAAIASVMYKHGADDAFIGDMAEVLARFNPNFDKTRFHTACVVGE